MKLVDIFSDIEFKGNKANIILKWVVAFASTAIVTAFIVGQFRVRHLDKLNDIERLAKEGIEKTEKLDKKIDQKFSEQDAKIEGIYTTGMEAFEEYREFNNEQFKLIIDHGAENKELVKKMLELNSKEKSYQIENEIERARRTKPDINSVIEVRPSPDEDIQMTVLVLTEVETGNTRYQVKNAHENYLDTLDLNKYEILSKTKSNYNGLYNFEYRTK